MVAPRLRPVKEREPVPPLKFAQLVGLFFAVVGAAAFAAGAFSVGVIASAAALVAAFLNAAFGICLGCQLYPLVARFRRAPEPRLTPFVRSNRKDSHHGTLGRPGRRRLG